ncbi:sensor domain-containing diguanylate cyclase [uncultured Neptuniibacter sp.]|uniref:GGDEF domain-containing protein n=1 Tax=uncultured Neptuniibacter sp. TaxID=502143 RepID=UPI0026045686|nr:sensor domain-containing diguanylate cyclase [uncultured Neptuniibacter sp.]
MWSLRGKISAWMMPLIVAILVLAHGYYKAHERLIIDHFKQSLLLAVSVGERELNYFIDTRDREFKQISAAMSRCDRVEESASERALWALRYTSGFSAMILSDNQGRTTHVELSSNSSNRFVLRQEVEGERLLSADSLAELRYRYDEWYRYLPQLKASEQQKLSELNAMASRGEVNSHRFRMAQQQLFDMKEVLNSPYPVISLSEADNAKKLGLPFSGSTLLFSKPILGCNAELLGYYTAYLDKTQLEDLLFIMKQNLHSNGFAEIDVTLIDNGTGQLLIPVRWIAEEPMKVGVMQEFYLPALSMKYGGMVASRLIERSQQITPVSHLHLDDDHRIDEALWPKPKPGVQLVVFISKKELKDLCDWLLVKVLLWSLLLVVISFGLILYLSNHIASPIVALRKQTALLAAGEYQESDFKARTDEIGELFQTFEEMAISIKSKERQLTALATQDFLTGVMNRRAFFSTAFEEHQRAIREGGTDITILMVDLDHFKQVNDQFGHKVGDQALVKLCRSIEMLLRVEDKLGRIGGEEFALLLIDSNEAQAIDIAERIRSSVEAMAFDEIGLPELQITISIGVSQWLHDESFETALSRADEKLYMAKQAGRNRVES